MDELGTDTARKRLWPKASKEERSSLARYAELVGLEAANRQYDALLRARARRQAERARAT